MIVRLEELRDASSPMVADLRRFLEAKVGVIAPGLAALEKALHLFLQVRDAEDRAAGRKVGPARSLPVGSFDFDDLKTLLRDPDWARTWISPVSGEDFRHLRPYFVVPLLETSFLGEQRLIREEVAKYVETLKGALPLIQSASVRGSEAMADDRPVTDIFVISHGWHRNYFAAVGVYDRLLSRFGTLCARDRIDMSSDKVRPLFLAMHWHSDPGKNGWVDVNGRRHRESFLENVRSLFEPEPNTPPSDLLSDFEELFVRLARLSTPDSVMGKDVTQGLDSLTLLLNKYRIRDAPVVAHPAVQIPREVLAHKVATLWRCYVEAQSKALLLDQDQKAAGFGSPLNAISTILKFALAVGGLGMFAGFLRAPWFQNIADWVYEAYARFVLGSYASAITAPFPAIVTLVYFAVVAVPTLYAVLLWRRRPRDVADPIDPMVKIPARVAAKERWSEAIANSGGVKLFDLKTRIRLFEKFYLQPEDQTESARGLPILPFVAWACLQVVCLVPVLLILIFTWIFRTVLAFLAVPVLILGTWFPPAYWVGGAWLGLCFLCAMAGFMLGKPVKGIFREKLQGADDYSRNMWDYLAAFARFPGNLARAAVSPDSSLRDMIRPLDNLLAFFEFQRKGVNAGRDAGWFVRRLLQEVPDLGGANIHFIGHSFGGLVVNNAVRTLLVYTNAKTKGIRKRLKIRDLQNRVDPYEYREISEPKVKSVTSLQGALASNWFSTDRDLMKIATDPAKRLTVASIYSKYDTANGVYYPFANNGRLATGYVGFDNASGPALGKDGAFAMVNAPPPEIAAASGPVLNIDASRLIYEGAVATGGGHDDIFKDDVIHLIWAISRR